MVLKVTEGRARRAQPVLQAAASEEGSRQYTTAQSAGAEWLEAANLHTSRPAPTLGAQTLEGEADQASGAFGGGTDTV